MMDRLTENKIILITRMTRLEELIKRFNTVEQAKFYIEHMGADFSDYVKEHKTYQQSLKFVESELKKMARVQVLERSFLPNFIFSKDDLIVVLGQDGLVVNTAKYLNEQMVVAINPDPDRWDGILLPFETKDIARIVPEVFKEKREIKNVTMAKAELKDGQKLYAVNDLFIGQKSHTSARYEIKLGKKQENHSSSGIIVSTGLGSTGWLTSIIIGASAIVAGTSKDKKNLKDRNKDIQPSWDMNYLYFSVREPFPSKTTSTSLIFGKITPDKPLILTSFMPENGVIFSDGIESDYIEFNSGSIARIGIAEKKVHIVI
ncbi:MAG: sugar kinase [Cyanobacteriota bacterium]